MRRYLTRRFVGAIVVTIALAALGYVSGVIGVNL